MDGNESPAEQQEPAREYGLGKAGKILGAPRVTTELKDNPPCPNCGCPRLFSIEVDLQLNPEHPAVQLLSGRQGLGTYVGCPACPWASPMVVITNAKVPYDGRN